MWMRQAIGLSLAIWAISGMAVAKPAVAADDRQHQPHSVKAKAAEAEPAAARHTARQRAKAKVEPSHREAAQHAASKPAHEDRVVDSSRAESQVKAVGKSEVGTAAWYGGRHLGLRTASGARLDAVTPTAAHRSLPLNSLVRITNLRNGKSVICTINDRGPWGANRLIDVSPKAADELDMKRSGIARVSVEPVAAPPHSPPD